jgi:hypothetical protein
VDRAPRERRDVAVSRADPIERDDASAAGGWDAIAEWTGGLAPDAVEALRGVRELEFVYPLLHALVGRSVPEFFVRAAWRMSPDDVATVPRRRLLSRRSVTAIRADLTARPDAPLADTLRAVLASHSWIEQEAWLGGAPAG